MTDASILPEQFTDIAAQILADGKIDESDVLSMRQGTFADGVVERDEVDLFFYLDAQDVEKHDSWKTFFVEILMTHFVWQAYPRGVLSDEDGAYLIERVTRDGKIDHDSEFALIVEIIAKARQCPEDVMMLALQAVEDDVLEGSGKLFGKGRRRAGIIDEDEVEIIEKVIYGSGGEGSLTITRREAELLFRLNNKTVGRKNAARWKGLFVTAVGSYLMHPGEAPKLIDPEEVRRRDESLAELAKPRSVFRKQSLSELLTPSGLLSREETFELIERGDKLRQKEEDETREALERVEAEFVREQVVREEVDWLIERITEDDVIHDNEKALLAYIKEKAVYIDPALVPYFEKYGV